MLATMPNPMHFKLKSEGGYFPEFFGKVSYSFGKISSIFYIKFLNESNKALYACPFLLSYRYIKVLKQFYDVKHNIMASPKSGTHAVKR